MKAEWTNADALTPSETTGKSILVIDTPKECDGCPCLNRKLWECQADKKRRSSDERPSWCPLKPTPEKICCGEKHSEAGMIYEAWAAGWNECVDYLEDIENDSN